MALNYAEQWSPELLEILMQGTLTSPFVTSNVRWLDAKTFHFTQMSTSGYKNHSRKGGWNVGSYEQKDVPYTLTHDRDVEFMVEGLNEYGEPLEPIQYSGKCNYQDKARTVLTAEKKLIKITGTALFCGDICPELPVISGGEAVIFGVKRRIEQGTKARNSDGSVNYTEVQLI